MEENEVLMDISTTGTIRDDLSMTEDAVILVIPIGGDPDEFS